MPAAGYLLLFLAAAVPEVAPEAGPTPVEVQWEGPAGCSGADAFFASLRSRTTHIRAAEGDEARTTLQVRLSRERGRVAGELRTVDNSGATDTRKVQGKSCDDVVQALSLTAALALDPTAVLSVSPEDSAAPPDRPAGTEKAPEPKETAPPVVEKPAPPIKEPPPEPAPATLSPPSSPRPMPSWELGAGLLGLSLLSGELSPGAAVDVQKNLGRGDLFRPALGLTVLYARNDLLSTPSAAAAGLVAGGALACPVRVSASVFTLQPCAAMWGGLFGAAGRQLTHQKRVDHLWLSAGATLRVFVLLGHGFSLRLEAGVQAPLIKRRYFATVPSNLIAQTPAISPVVGLALTRGFW